MAVYRIGLTVPPDVITRLHKSLSDDESARAARFVVPAVARQFIVARAALRAIVGRTVGLSPSAVAFSYGQYGKPYIRDTEVSFNLSHSDELALLCVTRWRDVGIDVEAVRPRTHLDRIARRFFSPRETEMLFALPENQRLDAFHRVWCRKEAYIKARGLGVFLGLDTFDVSLDENARLLATRPHAAEADRWVMRTLHAADGYHAALAVQAGPEFVLEMRDVYPTDLVGE